MNDHLRINLYTFLFAEETRVLNECNYLYESLDREDPVSCLDFVLAQERQRYFNELFRKLEFFLNS